MHLVADDIRIVSVDEVKELFARAATLLNSVRASARSLSEEQLRDLIDEKFRAVGLTHSELLRFLTHRLLSTIQIRG
jgi:hypothetical protein